MNQDKHVNENFKELTLYRTLLAIAGSVYLLWWFAVHTLFPTAFNPFLSRLSVVLYLYGVWGLTYLSETTRRYLRPLFLVGMWLITAHYYYLFYGNAGDMNWIMGSYITVIAISFGMFSHRALLLYSLYVVALSLALLIAVPSLQGSVFFLGLLTMLIQSNFGLRSRLILIKNLTASQERFQKLFNSTFEGVLVHQSGRIVNVNNALIYMLGYTRAELMGSDAFRLFAPQESDPHGAKLKNLQTEPYETQALTKSGTHLDIEVRGKDFTYEKSPAQLLTIQNISDRKQAEKERVVALTLAENIRVRDDFISIASHELKTPLSALQLQLQLIDRDIKKEGSDKELPLKMRDASHFLKSQVKRLTDLVEMMLDVSRMSSGNFTLSPSKVDLAALARRTVQNSISDHPDNKSLFQVDADTPAFVWGDELRLEQVVENLLSNALKYGKGNTINVQVYSESSKIFLTIIDHGMGIGAEYLPRIFDRFERGMSARNITGFGLGLYITKEIVEAHHGHISVESQLGVGSQFKVSFPKQVPGPIPGDTAS